MAKKGKKAKAKAAAAAAAAATSSVPDEPIVESTSLSELDLRLSKNLDLFEHAVPNLNHPTDETSTSYSLPSSPVVKATRSTQPSPALSATVSHGIDGDYRPVALPPLSIGERLDPGAVPDIDWSLFDPQPPRGKRQNKARASQLKSPVGQEIIEEEQVGDSMTSQS